MIMSWTSTPSYVDGRGFRCTDVYFGGQYKFTEVWDGENVWEERA